MGHLVAPPGHGGRRRPRASREEEEVRVDGEEGKGGEAGMIWMEKREE